MQTKQKITWEMKIEDEFLKMKKAILSFDFTLK